jgi:hypothetical protein
VKYLSVLAVRWVDDESIPGMVEVRFLDAQGADRVLVDKAPVFDAGNTLTPCAAYPIDLEIPIVVLQSRWSAGVEIAEIELPWGLDDGQNKPIEVHTNGLIERP